MATKPQPVPWEELNDLRFDLFEWLVDQKLAKAKEKPIAVAFKLQSDPRALSSDRRHLARSVIGGVLHIRTLAFSSAASRRCRSM